MLYQVTGASGRQWVNFAPSTVVEEVLQNVSTLLSTTKYSVPLDRDIGLEVTFIDRPTLDGMARLKVRIVEDIQRYEPRAKVKVVKFEPRPDDALRGAFYPVVKIEVLET